MYSSLFEIHAAGLNSDLILAALFLTSASVHMPVKIISNIKSIAKAQKIRQNSHRCGF